MIIYELTYNPVLDKESSMCKVEIPESDSGQKVVSQPDISVEMAQQVYQLSSKDHLKRPHQVCKQCGLEKTDCELAAQEGSCLLKAAEIVYSTA